MSAFSKKPEMEDSAWMEGGKPGSSAWVSRRCMPAWCLQQSALRRECSKMISQIATASFALLFATVLMLGSQRFVDSRASMLLPVIPAHGMR